MLAEYSIMFFERGTGTFPFKQRIGDFLALVLTWNGVRGTLYGARDSVEGDAIVC